MSRITTPLRRLFLFSLLMVGVVFWLPGCGGGGKKSAPPPPPPAITASPGYFDVINTLSGGDVYSDTGNTVSLHIADLRGMVYGNQFTLVSAANNLAYYATLTSLSGNNYTANVVIYQKNIPYGNTTLSGTLVAGTSLTGTFATTGTGLGKGTFQLDYSLANSSPAAVSRIVRDSSTTLVNWRNVSAGATYYSTFQIFSSGVLQNAGPTISGNFSLCNISGTVTPIPSTALYQVIMTLASCSTVTFNGTYTGLATSRKQTTIDDRLVVTVTSGMYSMNGEFQ